MTTQSVQRDDALARRNALILSSTQALYFVGASIQFALSGIVGHLLADDKSLATLPVSAYVLGTLSFIVPASYVMRAYGRRAGFQLGATFGLLSTLLAVYAIFVFEFWLFCLALYLSGWYQACAQYYRFAAADTASPSFRPTAISWVLAGGMVAAVAGPQLVIYTKALFAPVMYAGAFAAASVCSVIAFVILFLLHIPKPAVVAEGGAQPRPLTRILQQQKLNTAICTGMVSYASMTFLMTATPLAMIACNHPVDSAALAIQWHVLAMFAPSFFTGRLIARFGREPVVLAGLLLLGCAGLVGLSGIEIWHFNLAMILLGVGWNFGYIGSTTMVTDCHQPEERTKVQAFNEFMVFGLVAAASFASGKLLHEAGWETVSVSYLPFVAMAAGLVILLMTRERNAANLV